MELTKESIQSYILGRLNLKNLPDNNNRTFSHRSTSKVCYDVLCKFVAPKIAKLIVYGFKTTYGSINPKPYTLEGGMVQMYDACQLETLMSILHDLQHANWFDADFDKIYTNKVVEKLGFKSIGTFDYKRESFFREGEFDITKIMVYKHPEIEAYYAYAGSGYANLIFKDLEEGYKLAKEVAKVGDAEGLSFIQTSYGMAHSKVLLPLLEENGVEV